MLDFLFLQMIVLKENYKMLIFNTLYHFSSLSELWLSWWSSPKSLLLMTAEAPRTRSSAFCAAAYSAVLTSSPCSALNSSAFSIKVSSFSPATSPAFAIFAFSSSSLDSSTIFSLAASPSCFIFCEATSRLSLIYSGIFCFTSAIFCVTVVFS